ncbi:hypothetical protein H0H92_010939 [Tricholoma furcatifolium]|nr:hypothetical protein H0H92_010939 [Tricholoma furcatifolium]
MNAQMRYVLLILFVIVGLHYLLSISNESYGNATSLATIKGKFTKGQPPYKQPIPEEYYIKTNTSEVSTRKANAAFVILARNRELTGIVTSVKQMEDRFNKKFNYPYVFLNDEEFDESFKKRVAKLTDAKVEFGVIPKEHWVQPDSIDENRASESRANMVKNGVIYGGQDLPSFLIIWKLKKGVIRKCSVRIRSYQDALRYRNMCRFNSGARAFEAIQVLLESGNKVYEFTSKNPELIPEGNAMSFLSDDGGETYNRCHFWSNFEIADLDLWRGEAYSKFFDFLDEKGGFYYERWGDAPVHSIGAALFAKKEQIVTDMNLSSIVQKESPIQEGNVGVKSLKVSPSSSATRAVDIFIDYEWYSCLKRYDAMFA